MCPLIQRTRLEGSLWTDRAGLTWQWLLLLGVSTITLGAFAGIVVFQPNLGFDILVGLIFLITGLAHALHSFWSRKWGGFYFEVFGATHYLLVGLTLLANPGLGRTMVTLTLALFFIMQGMVQYGLSSQMSRNVGRNWMLASATLAVALGFIIWLQWPGNPHWLIGLFVSLHLLSRGSSVLAVALAMRQLGRVALQLPSHQRTDCYGGRSCWA